MIVDTPLRLGLPKGRFLDSSLAVVADLGCRLDNSRKSSWQIAGKTYNIVVKLLKVQDVTRLLQLGKLDLGVTADEWVHEFGVQLPPLVDLAWCITRIIFALPVEFVPKPAKNCLTIATPYPNLTRSHFAAKGIPCRIMPVAGATEGLTPDMCDGIVDCVETGQSLRDNRLRIHDVILNSSVRLFSRTSLNAAGVDSICKVFERHRKVATNEGTWQESSLFQSSREDERKTVQPQEKN